MCVLSFWAHLIYLSYVQRPVFSHSAPLFLLFPSSALNLHVGWDLLSVFPPSDVSLFYQLIVSLFSITSPPTCSFCHTSFPYFHLSSLHFLQQWGCPMNNSWALRDDNGKLEVRLCVAGVCGRLADSFQPGGNRKRLFIHIIYVNKMTLLFKVSEWGRVTTNLVAVERQSGDYGSAVTSTVSLNVITSITQSCPGGKWGGHHWGAEDKTRYMKRVARGPDMALCKCMCGQHKFIFVKLCG